MNNLRIKGFGSIVASCFLDRSQIVVLMQRILNDAILWHRYLDCDARSDRCVGIDKADSGFMREFSRYDKDLSKNLFVELGWTSYGAVALSWCAGVQLRDVWSGWLASGFPLKPLPEFERPARFLNPALLPQTASLREIVAWANGQGYTEVAMYDLAISAVIAGLKVPLIFDMPAGQMAQASPQIAAFLRSRLLQKPGYGAEELALLDAWGARIKGSAYDISEMV